MDWDMEKMTLITGGRKIPPEIAAELAEQCTEDTLIERELEILKRVAVGSSNKLVAAQLATTEATVKAHRKAFC
jgi:DNA-binding NarL/FixJ family response regulator